MAQGTTTVDFGSTPIDTKQFTITDAAMAGKTFVEAFIMGDDSTGNNDAQSHKQAAALMVLSAEVPIGNNFNVNADVLWGRVTGQFKLRYVGN